MFELQKAYEYVCKLIKQYLHKKITIGDVRVTVAEKYADVATKVSYMKLLFATEFLLEHAYFAKEIDTIPVVRIVNAGVDRGFSIVTIDSSQARRYIFNKSKDL